MTDFVSAMTKVVIGLGHNTEDGNPTPIIFRPSPAPVLGQQQEKQSPFPDQNPLPK